MKKVLYVIACLVFLFALFYPLHQFRLQAKVEKLEKLVDSQDTESYDFRLVEDEKTGKFNIVGLRSLKNENGAITISFHESGDRLVDTETPEYVIEGMVSSIKGQLNRRVFRYENDY